MSLAVQITSGIHFTACTSDIYLFVDSDISGFNELWRSCCFVRLNLDRLRVFQIQGSLNAPGSACSARPSPVGCSVPYLEVALMTTMKRQRVF
jgi:hypothetical protein